MIRIIKKTILKVFLIWHIIGLINKLQSNNYFFIMADQPWWVVMSLAHARDSITTDQNFNECMNFLVSEAKKELFLRDRQLNRV